MAWLARLGAVLVAAALVAGCRYGVTEVLVTVATDVPADQPMTVAAFVRRGRTTIPPGAPADYVWRRALPDEPRDAGGATAFDAAGATTRDAGSVPTLDAGIVLPATFAVVPLRDEPRDDVVSLLVTAQTPDGTIRRAATFRFVPRQSVRLTVFLTQLCLQTDPDHTCGGRPCTRQEFCEAAGRTCGNDGRCAEVTQDLSTPSDATVVAVADTRPPATEGGFDAPIDRGPVRDCTGRQCGDDGVGGSCGTCPAGQRCTPTGQCACAPNCAGRQCGDDGCRGSCGGCPANYVCNAAGQCVCVPNCAGRVCGHDGCGGSCGGCPADYGCDDPSGQCVCAPGTNGVCTPACGETCWGSADCHNASCACYARCCDGCLNGPFWVATSADCYNLRTTACGSAGVFRESYGTSGACIFQRSAACPCCSGGNTCGRCGSCGGGSCDATPSRYCPASMPSCP